MATFSKFNSFVEYLGEKVFDFNNDTFKVVLTNSAPSAANTVLTDITQISAGTGYTTGGNAATVTSWGQSSGTAKLILADPTTWTATGSMGPFRYAVLYDDTPTSPADPLIGYWDYGSSVQLASTETFTVDFDGTNGVFTVA